LLGVSWESGQDSINEDPTGISLHNVQWASLVFGGAGGGFSWWWDSCNKKKKKKKRGKSNNTIKIKMKNKDH
jgi:hypothetical protein